jgi:YggT family protein
MPYLANAGTILIQVIFELAAWVFALRVLLQWVGANFNNPICQALYRLTNPVLMPLRRVLRPWRRLDLAGALVVLLLQCLKAWLLLALAGITAGIGAPLVLGAAETLSMLLVMFLIFILIRSILSWIGPSPRHPAIPLLIQLTEPVLRPLRRLLPAMGGFDLSPLLAMLVILLARALCVAPLLDWGATLLR